MQACSVTKTVYTENIFNKWLGRSTQDLMLQHGSPDRIVEDGKGGQIYVYDNSSTVTAGLSGPGQFYASPTGVAVPGNQQAYLNYQPGATVSNSFVVEKKVEFFVNGDGYIYAWHTTGYPHTFEQQYTKKELKSGMVDTTLFMPPVKPKFEPQAPTRTTNNILFDSINYSGYKRRNN